MHGHNWLAHAYLPLRRRRTAAFVQSLHDYSLVCANKRLVRLDEPCSGPGLTKCVACAGRQYGVLTGPPVALLTRAGCRAQRRAVDRFLPVSSEVAARCRLADMGVPFEVVPNFLLDGPESAAHHDPVLDGLPDREFLLYVGDLTHDKGVGVLLEAHAAMDRRPPLVLIGRIADPSLARAREDVTVLGPAGHAAVLAAWQRCTVAVVPSITPETFGLVALEAMAAGRPVVAARAGGLPEVVRDRESGLLVPPGDPQALRAALEAVMGDHALRAQLSSGALERAAAFTPQVVLPRFEQAYERARATRAPGDRRMTTAPHALGAGAALPRAGSRLGRLGAFPLLALSAGAGLLLVAVADALSRSGHPHSSLPFWLGIIAILFPAAMRMAGAEATSGERVATVVLVALSLYAVKVLRDPFAFTFGDELAHLHNVTEILRRGDIFGTNSILPITPRYPGLESTAGALSALGGSSPFAAGLLLIAAARVTLLLALYLFYERLVGSARVAGIAALVYAATPTFVYFSAQFSYESLALPLASVGLLALLRWMTAQQPGERHGWAAVVVLCAAALIPTHHITSYAFAGFLLAVSVLHLVLRGRHARGAPWVLTAVVGAMTLAWLTFVAGTTVGYLSPVLTDAVNHVVDTIRRESGTRTLFKSDSGAESTPPAERLVALLAVGALTVAVVAGVRVVWQRWRRDPLVVLLAFGAIAYLGTFPLRFVPAAWETASRASGFLIVGVALVTGLASVRLLERRPRARSLVAAGVVLVVAGGIISGWPASLRQGRPLRVTAGGREIQPPALAAARWTRDGLGTGRRFISEDADSRLLVIDGHQVAYQGTNPDFNTVLQSTTLEPWMIPLLRSRRIPFVFADRRTISADNIAGYFFDVRAPSLFPAASTAKFDLPRVDRLYDSGDIVVFDVRGLW